ncbi:MLV-related proviral Env polyprotein-like [Lutra lutra]|uniref:MLV-related proviral Env polyprotein-like n=1 Tax=Lutra lutra TaxID=9657 RepID=UPI001FD0A05C|nr:MLV-related proviral Env polyprotein-like [Lutra lutra]
MQLSPCLTPLGTTTRQKVCPKLRALYETGPPPDPHRYRPGDWVYVRRHQHQTLQLHWKGPYIVILTTPTTLKVDRITPWVHYTHVWPAEPHVVLKDFVPEWKSQPNKDNPLKLRRHRSHLPSHTRANPHQPLNLTWQVICVSTAEVVYSLSKIAPQQAWFPDLTLDLTKILGNTHLHGLRSQLYKRYFYVCPGHLTGNRARHCGGPSHFYCASWSCVSTGEIWWTAPYKDDLITLKRYRTSQSSETGNLITLKFTEAGKLDTRWQVGLTWGLRIYDVVRLGYQDPGTLFTLRLLAQNYQVNLGPNPVLAPSKTQITPIPPPPPSPIPTIPSASNNTSNVDMITPVPTPFPQDPPSPPYLRALHYQ